MTEKVVTEFQFDAMDSQDATWEMRVAKRITDHLQKHYPDHLWAVNVNSKGGTVNIFNLALSSLWGYVLHLTTVLNDPQLKKVTQAGGELLERANMKKRFRGELPAHIDGMPDKYQPGARLKLN